tara:strand:+ start:677 stop:883 length:207 start_codon:yes stop_codon:yes gene_type:complete
MKIGRKLFSIRLREDLLDDLKTVSFFKKTTMTRLIENSLDQYLPPLLQSATKEKTENLVRRVQGAGEQ